MRYIEFETKNFGEKALMQIERADKIINQYHGDGYVLTLRQLYYQFVSRAWVENTERSYKNLGSLVTDARIAGLLPWDGIEDRAREHHMFYFNESIQECFRDIEMQYAVDMWARQPNYVEVWVEKEALGNVIERPCRKYLVPFMSCKGYLSASQAWRAGERFEEAANNGKNCYLIHLGDHDPSGIDMTRDNGDRLGMFARSSDIEVRRIAMNMDQVKRYKPPPNPAKITDSRAADYIRKFGESSWELDALEPSVIDKLITDEIVDLIDPDVWKDAKEEQADKRRKIVDLYSNLDTGDED